ELRAVYEAAHREQMEAYRSLQQERADARHQKHMAFACDTAWQMVGFAEQAIKYREESDGAKVPKALYRQWAAMFTVGDPELAAQPAAVVTSPQPAVTAADEQAVTEYLGWSGVWQASSPDQATGYNELLADVIAEGATAGASKASPQGASLQDIPLRLALVGAPFAGKTSMALKLADEHGCKVLNMSELVNEAATVAEAFDKQGPSSGSEPGTGPAGSEVPIKVQLGRTAQANLQSNGVVSDEVQTQLMVLAIDEVARAIAAQPPAPLSAGAKPAGGKPAASKGKKDDAKPVQGYVMDGYPSSVRQAELLEGALTGLDLTAERTTIASASRLAPPRPATLPDLNRPLTSGLDAVLVLELDDEALAVKRALGRRVDPLTGRVYHLEFDVPPPKEPGLAARLKAAAVETNEGGQLTDRLARHAQQAPVLNAWLAKFPTLRQGLPAQNSLAEVSTAVDGVAGRILASKAALAAIKAASAAAQQAQAAAEGSAVQAGHAQQAAQGAARALLASKRAEIEAADMLEKTKNPKDADPAAADLLKVSCCSKPDLGFVTSTFCTLRLLLCSLVDEHAQAAFS
ncbi:MAG: central pair complex 1, partial [Trebouxia sp. A1-2]